MWLDEFKKYKDAVNAEYSEIGALVRTKSALDDIPGTFKDLSMLNEEQLKEKYGTHTLELSYQVMQKVFKELIKQYPYTVKYIELKKGYSITLLDLLCAKDKSEVTVPYGYYTASTGVYSWYMNSKIFNLYTDSYEVPTKQEFRLAQDIEEWNNFDFSERSYQSILGSIFHAVGNRLRLTSQMRVFIYREYFSNARYYDLLSKYLEEDHLGIRTYLEGIETKVKEYEKINKLKELRNKAIEEVLNKKDTVFDVFGIKIKLVDF